MPSAKEIKKKEKEKKLNKMRQILQFTNDEEALYFIEEKRFLGIFKYKVKTPKPTLEENLTQARRGALEYTGPANSDSDGNDDDEDELIGRNQVADSRPVTAGSTSVGDGLSTLGPGTTEGGSTRPPTSGTLASDDQAQTSDTVSNAPEDTDQKQENVAGKRGLLSMLFKRKEKTPPKPKKTLDEEVAEILANDNYEQDKPIEKPPTPPTKPVRRPPRSHQTVRDVTSQFSYDIRAPWSEFRIYIIHTGDDMLAERHVLFSEVLPELQALAAAHRLRVTLVDIWSGLDQRNGRKVAIVERLREIDRAGGCMVLLSRRYGEPVHLSDFKSTRFTDKQRKFLKDLSLDPLPSIFQVEAQYAAARKPDDYVYNHCLPYLFVGERNPNFLRGQPDEVMNFFRNRDPALSQSIRRIRRQLLRVPGALTLEAYPAKFGGVIDGVPVVEGLDEFAESIIDQTIIWIRDSFPLKSEHVLVDSDLIDEQTQKYWVSKMLPPHFEVPETLMKQLLDYCIQENSDICMLHGPVGSGKSATLVHFLDAYAEYRNRARVKILYHSCEANADARIPIRMLQRLCFLLVDHFKLEDEFEDFDAVGSPVKQAALRKKRSNVRRKLNLMKADKKKPSLPDEFGKLCDLFRLLLVQASRSFVGDELLLIIDGIELLDHSSVEWIKDTRVFDFLPLKMPLDGFPVRMIISCTAGPAAESVRQFHKSRGMQFKEIKTSPLSDDSAVNLVKENLAQHALEQYRKRPQKRARRKSIIQNQESGADGEGTGEEEEEPDAILILRKLDKTAEKAAEEVITKAGGHTPLFLFLAQREIWSAVLFGQGIALKKGISIRDGVSGLVADAIRNVEHKFDKNTGWTKDLVCALTIVRRGLLDSEAWGILASTYTARFEDEAAPFHVWLNIRDALSPLMAPICDTIDSTMRWMHTHVADCVYTHFLSSERASKGIHRTVAEYFAGIVDELYLPAIGESLDQWLQDTVLSDECARALNEVAFHRIMGQQAGHVETTLSSLRFVEVRLMLGQLTDLINDYKLGIELLDWRGMHVQAKRLSDFREFLIKEGKSLKGRSAATFQEAMNLPIHMAPARAARTLVKLGAEQRRWVKHINPKDSSGGVDIDSGHSGSIVAVQFTQDFKNLVTAGADCQVNVFDAFSGEFSGCMGETQAHGKPTSIATTEEEGKEGIMQHFAIVTTNQGKALRFSFSSLCQIGMTHISPSCISCICNTHANGLWCAGFDMKIYVLGDEGSTQFFLDSHHRDKVTDITSSVCGSRVATASLDKSIRIWDVSSRQMISVLVGHLQPIFSISFSAGPDAIFSGSLDGQIKSWQIDARVVKSTMAGHKGKVFVHGGAVAPQAFSCCIDGTARVWDPETCGEIERLVSKPEDEFTCIAVSDDDRRIVTCTASGRVFIRPVHFHHFGQIAKLAFIGPNELMTCSYDKIIKLWDVGVGTEVGKLIGHNKEVMQFDAARVGSRIMATTASIDGSCQVWDLVQGSRLAKMQISKKGVLCTSIQPDKGVIAAGTVEGNVHLFDATTFLEFCTCAGHTGMIRAVKFVLGGEMLVSTSEDSTARIWFTSNGQYASVLSGHMSAITCASLNGEGTVLLTGSKDTTLRSWDLNAALASKLLVGHKAALTSVIFLPLQPSRLLTAANDGTCKVWDIESLKTETTIPGNSNVRSLACSGDGQVVVMGDNSGTVQTLKGLDLAFIRTVRSDSGPVLHLSINHNGKHCCATFQDGSARHFNPTTGEVHAAPPIVDGMWMCSQFSHDSKLLALGLDDGQTHVMNPSTGNVLFKFHGHKFRITCICFDADDEYILTGSFDCDIRVWHAENGMLRTVIRGHAAPVLSLCAMKFGPFIVSVSADRTARVWHNLTTEQLFLLSAHGSGVVDVAIDERGMVATSSQDHTCRLWNLIPPWGKDLGSQISYMTGHTGIVRHCDITRDGKYALSCGSEGSVRMWSIASGNCSRQLDGHHFPCTICSFIPVPTDPRRYAVTADTKGMIFFWDIEESKMVVSMKLPTKITAVCVSHDSNVVALGDANGDMQLLELQGFMAYLSKEQKPGIGSIAGDSIAQIE